MSTSSPHAALGLIVVLLSCVALAAARDARRTSGPAELERPQPAASTVTVRALRDGETIDLNTASQADLELLPRIGPALAGRILAERTRRGRFEAVDDLRQVRGIGPVTLEGLRALVRVADQGSSSSDTLSPHVK